MNLGKFRWSRVYESSEDELIDLFESLGIKAVRHHVEEFQELQDKAFNQDTILWCAEGSAIFDFGTARFSAQPGDGLNIPADTAFTATAGISGCAYYVR